MEYLSGENEAAAIKWMTRATEAAKKALCLKAKCGVVVVMLDKVIGEGYNAPPLDNINNRFCLDPNHKHDSCVHAEWRAITDALKRNHADLKGAVLYFTRVDDTDAVIKSGKPYCTVCSRLALDVGIRKFVLWHKEGICEYTTEEYNNMSYNFRS